MEHTPPPPPVQQQASQSNCQWCSKPMESNAIRCLSCGKLRKDIYTDKIKSYSFSILAILLVLIGSFAIKGRQTQYDMFYQQNTSGNSTLKIIIIVFGMIAAGVSIYFYVKASQKMKTWWWV